MSSPDRSALAHTDVGRLPDFVVIGAMKSGTSSLHDQLGANRQIFMSDPKEPNFFSDDPIFERGLPWYRDLFASASRDQLCGESSTHYTKQPTHPDAAQRLIQALPEVRLLYVVRDPIDRIVSQYIHEWSQREVVGDIEHAIAEQPRFVAYSRYAMQLRPYLEAFGAERIQVVFFERLMRAPQQELDRIRRFLALESDLVWDSDRGAQNASRDRMQKNPLRDAIVNAPGLAALRRTLIPQAVRDRIKRFWQMEERPRLSERTRERLEQRLDLDLHELGEWLGAPDLGCRNFAASTQRMTGDWAAAARAHFPGN